MRRIGVWIIGSGKAVRKFAAFKSGTGVSPVNGARDSSPWSRARFPPAVTTFQPVVTRKMRVPHSRCYTSRRSPSGQGFQIRLANLDSRWGKCLSLSSQLNRNASLCRSFSRVSKSNRTHTGLFQVAFFEGLARRMRAVPGAVPGRIPGRALDEYRRVARNPGW
jgi:hypothetical protein